MKNLGKNTLFLLLFANALHAGVVASVSAQSVELGESVTLTLDISGESIQKPSIHSLCGSNISSSGSSTNIQSINGMYKKSSILSYRFLPQKSCEIEPIDILVDGKVEKTELIKIQVKPVSQAKDADIILSLESSKKELFVGEPFELTLLFKQKQNIQALDSKFTPPDLKGLWIKNESVPQQYEDGEYKITKVIYTMAAQREGLLNISSAQMAIASRSNTNDAWGTWVANVAWKSYFSNELEISVKPLPEGVNLVGDMNISVRVEQNQINANEALNVHVEVEGAANLEDIKTFKPSIEGVSVFDEKIVIEGEKLSQKMAFVSDEDFVVPSFVLRYFDTQTQEIKSVQTQAIPIKVSNTKPKQELIIQREQNQTESAPSASSESEYGIILGFLAGVIFGVLLTLYKPWRFFQKRKSLSLGTPREQLAKLLPYKEDADAQALIETLEKNIYSNQDIKIDKKLLKELLKKYSQKSNKNM